MISLPAECLGTRMKRPRGDFDVEIIKLFLVYFFPEDLQDPKNLLYSPASSDYAACKM